MRDTVLGLTQRVSVDPAGNQLKETSTDPAISADGQHVAFATTSTAVVENLSPPENAPYQQHVIVRSLAAGTNYLVAQGFRPSLSADGAYVAYSSTGSTIAVAETRTRAVITTASGRNPQISADGHHAAWDHNGSVYTRGLDSTSPIPVSIAADGSLSQGTKPSLSADGSRIAFESNASNLVAGDHNDTNDIYVRDTVANTTARVSVASDGSDSLAWITTRPGNGSRLPSMSADGQQIAFVSTATNLVPQQPNFLQKAVYVRGNR